MKTVGLLGGMSYHATSLYYSQINAQVQRRLGSPQSASLILHSFNYGDLNPLFTATRWDAIADRFAKAGKNLKASGADGLVIGCNIGHAVAEELEAAVGLPVLHIGDATAKALSLGNVKCPGLLATKPVMEMDFLKSRLIQKAGLADLLVPERQDWDTLNGLVFGELAAGKVSDETRQWTAGLVNGLLGKGADALVLACTELQFMVKPGDTPVPVFDTLGIHSRYIADWMIDR